MSNQTEVEESRETYLYDASAQNHASMAIPPQNQMETGELPDLFLPPPMYEPEADELQYEAFLETYPPPIDIDTTFTENNQTLNPNNDDKLIITINIAPGQLKPFLVALILIALSLFIRAYGLPIIRFLWNYAPAIKSSIRFHLKSSPMLRYIREVVSSFWAQHQSAFWSKFWWTMNRMGALLVVKFVLDLVLEGLRRERPLVFGNF